VLALHRHVHGHVHVDAPKGLLGQREVHEHRVEGLQRGQRDARTYVLAEIYRADAETTCEGGANCLTRDLGL
jgi:hypothetical protein